MHFLISGAVSEIRRNKKIERIENNFLKFLEPATPGYARFEFIENRLVYQFIDAPTGNVLYENSLRHIEPIGPPSEHISHTTEGMIPNGVLFVEFIQVILIILLV
jgi:hypothetical protein